MKKLIIALSFLIALQCISVEVPINTTVEITLEATTVELYSVRLDPATGTWHLSGEINWVVPAIDGEFSVRSGFNETVTRDEAAAYLEISIDAYLTGVTASELTRAVTQIATAKVVAKYMGD